MQLVKVNITGLTACHTPEPVLIHRDTGGLINLVRYLISSTALISAGMEIHVSEDNLVSNIVVSDSTGKPM